MNEKFMLKALPKMEMEISLIKAMVDVLVYENTLAPITNDAVVAAAHEILANKVLEISKVLKNPSRYDKELGLEDDLLIKK